MIWMMTTRMKEKRMFRFEFLVYRSSFFALPSSEKIANCLLLLLLLLLLFFRVCIIRRFQRRRRTIKPCFALSTIAIRCADHTRGSCDGYYLYRMMMTAEGGSSYCTYDYLLYYETVL